MVNLPAQVEIMVPVAAVECLEAAPITPALAQVYLHQRQVLQEDCLVARRKMRHQLVLFLAALPARLLPVEEMARPSLAQMPLRSPRHWASTSRMSRNLRLLQEARSSAVLALKQNLPSHRMQQAAASLDREKLARRVQACLAQI